MLGDNQPLLDDIPPLASFELPDFLVRPAIMACRGFNSAVDAVFYDVVTLRKDLRDRQGEAARQGERELNALTDPEGCLLLLDPAHPPYVRKFTDVTCFLDSPLPETKQVDVATITGVGSSALGSAAMGWGVAKALGAPALAIVPGYGVADLMLQALGGWFGFGLYDYLGAKSVAQNALANVAPRAAGIGRRLSATAPGAKTVHGAPVFRHGSGSSDVLHALMRDRPRPFGLLVGHSKGALQIANALGSLKAERTRGLHVVTLGCPIATDVEGATYFQYLGLFDALGQLNMWGHWPDRWTPTWHSTNPYLPPAMDAGALVRDAQAHSV